MVRAPKDKLGELVRPPTYVFPAASTSKAHGYSILPPPPSIAHMPVPSAASTLATKVSVEPRERRVRPPSSAQPEYGPPMSMTDSPSCEARMPRQ